MNTSRTGGMTAIGVLNIVFGSICTLLGLAIVLLGGVVAAAAGSIEANNPDMEGMEAMATAGGAIMAVVGVIFTVLSILTIIAGVGTLKLSPWARPMSIVAGTLFAVLGVFSQFDGIDIVAIGSGAYGVLLVALFFRSDWKLAFSKEGAVQRMGDSYGGGISTGSPLAGAVPQAEPEAMGSTGTPGIPGLPTATPVDDQRDAA